MGEDLRPGREAREICDRCMGVTDRSIRPLRRILERHKPSDPIPAIAWLFDTWMLDAHSNQDGADKRRVDALRNLLADHGLASILRLGLEVKRPDTVVQALRTGRSFSQPA